MLTESEADDLRASCTRFLAGHGPTRAAELLAGIPTDTVVDRYGDGGVVAELEARIAELLGTEAAVFLPSGIMAQQIVLRVHADRRARRTVLYHPMCHLEHHEGRALERLQGLIGRPVGEAHRLLTAADLDTVAEPPAALLIELPQRDLGGRQPEWADLEAQVAWARERGAAAHLDGARLWESAAGYGVPPARIAALFDSVYVSFYKGVGALAGCCVAGDGALVGEVREWRRRMGGTLFGLWPLAASALALLPGRLERMPRYLEQARAIAAALAGVPGVRVVPDPPQTPMMHLLLDADEATVDAAVRRLAADGTWTVRGASPTADPAVLRVELPVGDATCSFAPEEAARVIAALVQRA
jgi:threonine aldolase